MLRLKVRMGLVFLSLLMILEKIGEKLPRMLLVAEYSLLILKRVWCTKKRPWHFLTKGGNALNRGQKLRGFYCNGFARECLIKIKGSQCWSG
jgi:hypothetical protein